VDSTASSVIQQFNVVTCLYCFAEWKKHKLCSAGLPHLPFAISLAMVRQGVLAKRFGWSSRHAWFIHYIRDVVLGGCADVVAYFPSLGAQFLRLLCFRFSYKVFPHNSHAITERAEHGPFLVIELQKNVMVQNAMMPLLL
jgi:hypothetical protein